MCSTSMMHPIQARRTVDCRIARSGGGGGGEGGEIRLCGQFYTCDNFHTSPTMFLDGTYTFDSSHGIADPCVQKDVVIWRNTQNNLEVLCFSDQNKRKMG